MLAFLELTGTYVGLYLQTTGLQERLKALTEPGEAPSISVSPSYDPDRIIGTSACMRAIMQEIAQAARSRSTILLRGESGTGKDAYARLIHRLSLKGELRLQKIDCATFDPTQLTTQMRQSPQGFLSPEAYGTIYFDNVQELGIASQRALLSLLPDEQSSDRKEEKCCRVISSAPRSLESEVEEGRFRRELYFRLNGACLRLPPLRERAEDIPALTEHFLNKHAVHLKRKQLPVGNKAMQDLVAYHWPGNIRELENLARKIVVFGNVQLVLNDLHGAWISDHTPIENGSQASLKAAARAASKRAERELIMQALERTHWNRKRAARELQISYKSLLYKIKQIGEPKT
jgi:DNA-binding NtrC family response regulator